MTGKMAKRHQQHALSTTQRERHCKSEPGGCPTRCPSSVGSNVCLLQETCLQADSATQAHVQTPRTPVCNMPAAEWLLNNEASERSCGHLLRGQHQGEKHRVTLHGCSPGSVGRHRCRSRCKCTGCVRRKSSCIVAGRKGRTRVCLHLTPSPARALAPPASPATRRVRADGVLASVMAPFFQ